MGTPYTPSAVAIGTITVPADGDARNAAVFNVPMQAIADGVKFATVRSDVLADLAALAAITTPADGLVRHVLGFGDYVFKTSATTGISPWRVAAGDATAGGWKSSTAHDTTLTRMVGAAQLQPGAMVGGIAQAPTATGSTFAAWTPATAAQLSMGTAAPWTVTDAVAVTTASGVSVPLRFPIDQYLVDGATLASITMRILGAAAHGALPLLMPSIGVQRVDLDGTATALLSTAAGMAFDPTAVLATYKAVHGFTWTADQNNVIDKANYSYALIFYNEGNTNAVAGQILNSISISMTAIPDARRS